jgi:hypothetical protein
MTASQPTLLKIMVSPIARSGRVHICQQTLVHIVYQGCQIKSQPDTSYELLLGKGEHSLDELLKNELRDPLIRMGV